MKAQGRNDLSIVPPNCLGGERTVHLIGLHSCQTVRVGRRAIRLIWNAWAACGPMCGNAAPFPEAGWNEL